MFMGTHFVLVSGRGAPRDDLQYVCSTSQLRRGFHRWQVTYRYTPRTMRPCLAAPNISSTTSPASWECGLTLDRMVELSIRRAEHSDAEAIRAIYNPEVESSLVTFDLVPRNLDEQHTWIEEHSGAHPAIVAVDEQGEVVGFGSLSPYRPRPAYAPTVEDSVYVRRNMQGRGVGGLLLAELVRLAEANGFHSVVARVVGGHEASVALHERCGFEQIGVEREVGRKLGQWLDVVLMQRML